MAIRSPITGTIRAVYFRPGQAVRAGDPILTVADSRSQHIVAYIRQQQGGEPRIGNPVDVRTRSMGRRTALQGGG